MSSTPATESDFESTLPQNEQADAVSDANPAMSTLPQNDHQDDALDANQTSSTIADDTPRTNVKFDIAETTRMYFCTRIQEAIKLGKQSQSETGAVARESIIKAFNIVFTMFEMSLNFVINSVNDPLYKKKITWPRSLERMRIIVYTYDKAISSDFAEILLRICSDKCYSLSLMVSEIKPCLSMYISLPPVLDKLLDTLINDAKLMLPFISKLVPEQNSHEESC
jgi:hypothetical protein